MLREDQVAFYRDNGYLVIPDVFSAEQLTDLNAVTDTFVERSRDIVESDTVLDIAPDHTAEVPKLRRVKDPTRQHEIYDRASRDPALLVILQQLLGPSIRFDHGKLNFKPVGGGATIEWHQDWAFYPHTNDDMLAVGLYLEDCGLENGPLQVIPGSHTGPVHDHHHNGVFVGASDPVAFQDRLPDAVPLTGKAGSITIHHVRTMHASTENTGDRERRLLLFSYAAVDAWPLYPQPDFEEFNSRILTGSPTFEPRQTAVPIRLPLPPVENADSIYDDQAAVLGRSFAA